MLAIRLQRVGRKKQPIYRVVISEKTKDTYGDHLEILGQYNPHSKEATLKEDRIKHWLENGAQTSPSVNNLFIKEGLMQGEKAKSVAISKKRKSKKAEDEAKKAEVSDKEEKEAKSAEQLKEGAPKEGADKEEKEKKEEPAPKDESDDSKEEDKKEK